MATNNSFKIQALITGILSLVLLSGCEQPSEQSGIDEPVSTAAMNVVVFPEQILMTSLDRKRQLRVYLPPDYEQSNSAYPVIYMQDGQNLFDDATAYLGEWQVDETLNTIYELSGQGYIVVGIDNGHELRMNEYSPWTNPDYGDAEGEQYIDFLVSELKPLIDSQYRTLSDPDNTIIMGSSMGGLIVHYAVFKYPEVFGKAGIYSPSYWFNEAVYEFTEEQLPTMTSDHQLHILVGGKEGPGMVENVVRMQELIESSSTERPNLKVTIIPDGEHKEQFWRNHFASSIRFFGARAKTI